MTNLLMCRGVWFWSENVPKRILLCELKFHLNNSSRPLVIKNMAEGRYTQYTPPPPTLRLMVNRLDASVASKSIEWFLYEGNTDI